MTKYFIVSIVCSIIHSQTINFSPKFKFDYQSDKESYAVDNLSIIDYDFVIDTYYKYNRLSLISRAGYHLVAGTLLEPSSFTRIQGLHYFPHDKGLENQRNYWISDMKLQYGDSLSYWFINKWDKHWGPGVNSLTVSNKVPSFFHFGFIQKLTNNINFEYFHGKLKSNIDDSIYARYYDFGIGSNPIDINRNIVGHRIEWGLSRFVTLSASELIVYSNRELEFTYLLPFVPFFPIQSYIGETDNVIMSADIQYLPLNGLRLYGSFMMDEWAPTYTFSKDNNNWFGYLLGLDKMNLILKNDRFRLEFTWTDHRIYRHRYPVNNYYSWGYPIGFWAGPHAEELYIDYMFDINKVQFNIIFSNARRGELTYEMLKEQYSSPGPDRLVYRRFSGFFEQRKIIKFFVKRQFYRSFFTTLSFTYLDWDNANFIPDDVSDDLIDLNKYSIGLGVAVEY